MKDITPQIEAVAKQYHYSRPPDFLVNLEHLYLRALQILREFLESLRFMPFISSDSMGASQLIRLAVLAAGAAALIALIFVAIKRAHKIQKEKNAARKGQESAGTILNAREWDEEAERLAQNGEWREACRALYLSLLRTLHERQIIDFQPTRTNYEYWYALAPYADLAKEFKTLANLIESIWFGNQQAGEENYRQFHKSLEQIKIDAAQIKAAPEQTPSTTP